MKTYIVRGSDDGNLGVFGSVGRAYLRAIDYVSWSRFDQHCPPFLEYPSKETGACELIKGEATYSQVARQMRKHGVCEIISQHPNGRVSATIEYFELNQI